MIIILLYNLLLFTKIRVVSGSSVWIIGSSIVRDAYFRSLHRPDGPGLGLAEFGIGVYWEHQSGMRLCNVLELATYMKNFYPLPDLLVLHCGGNDIGFKPMVEVTWEAKTICDQLKSLLPHTILVWSQILPRKSWRYIAMTSVAERSRKRINSCISTYYINRGGRTVKYPDITNDFRLFKADGVHLSVLGCDLMLNNLSGAVYAFLNSSDVVFPLCI